MTPWLPLLMLGQLTEPPALDQPLRVKVIVLLCDGDKLACGAGLGDPKSVEKNLYWGALYGADRTLRNSTAYARRQRLDSTTVQGPILAQVDYDRRPARGERALSATLVAYDGREPRRALADFVRDAGSGRFDLVVWIGHDVLMDFTYDSAPASDGGNVAVLACDSEAHFQPLLRQMGVRPLALTSSFMAPEGYLLDALLDSVARHGPTDRVRARAALIAAYARFQRITPSAARTVFTKLPQ